MSKLDELAAVVRLALVTEDRTKAEQRALIAVAQRVDKEWNAQRGNNPKLKGVRLAPCTYSVDHPKVPRCPCHGAGVMRDGVRYALEPVGGWSTLEQAARDLFDEPVRPVAVVELPA